MNFSKIELLKANWIRLVREIKFSRAVTFNFGTTLLPETAASKIEEFCKRIEDKAFGRNWYKRKNGRLTVVAFMEHVDSNTHYHGYVRGGSKVRIALKRHGDRMWKKLAPRGQLDYGPILHRERMITISRKKCASLVGPTTYAYTLDREGFFIAPSRRKLVWKS